jgi:hypothetical protein
MADLREAFNIPINPQNKEFVLNPYIPIQTIGKKPEDPVIEANVMTIGRCFDVKYGARNCFKSLP